MIKLCFITGEISDDFEEALKLGLEAGVDTVQLRKGLFGTNVDYLDDDDILRVKDVLATYRRARVKIRQRDLGDRLRGALRPASF